MRWREDLSWLPRFTDMMSPYIPWNDTLLTIYDKGSVEYPLVYGTQVQWLGPMTVINLPNIGRDGHTVLHHITQNYDALARHTFFLQGK
jgi:hypothetical protein